MADSTLDPDNFGRRDRRTGLGHGIEALGPSDTSDSGSDMVGAAGLSADEVIPLDTGTNSDAQLGRRGNTAGPDIGDADLDSDTDAGGTGERATAGLDTPFISGADINVDQIQDVPTQEELEAALKEDADALSTLDALDGLKAPNVKAQDSRSAPG